MKKIDSCGMDKHVKNGSIREGIGGIQQIHCYKLAAENWRIKGKKTLGFDLVGMFKFVLNICFVIFDFSVV